MLFHRLVAYRTLRGEPVNTDFHMLTLFGKWIDDEIKELAFDQLFRRSWNQNG